MSKHSDEKSFSHILFVNRVGVGGWGSYSRLYPAAIHQGATAVF